LEAPELAILKKIHIETGRKIDTLFSGDYRSAFRGQGLAFESVREYIPGDDVRSIDWNVSARMNHMYVKEYTEERELSVLLMVDVSGSTEFGSRGTKRSTILEFTAIMLHLAQMNHDRVSVVLFSHKVEKFLKAKKGRKFVLKVLDEITRVSPRAKRTDISAAVDFAGRVMKKRSIVFVVSDFMDSEERYLPRLRHMAERHDVICVRAEDPFEKRFPFTGLVECLDLETGRVYLNESVPLERVLPGTGLFDTIRLAAGEPVEAPLLRFFESRRLRAVYR